MIFVSIVDDLAKDDNVHKPTQEELDDIFRSKDIDEEGAKYEVDS